MIRLTSLLFLLLWAAPSLFAQTLDPALQEAVNAAVPPQYLVYLPLVLLLLGAYGRFAKARKNGLSVIDAILAVVQGTNTPTAPLLIACLCLLSLSSCATANAILTSPFGRAAFATADQLAKAVVESTQQVALEQIILQSKAKIAALNADGVNSDLVRETLRLSEIAGLKAVVIAAEEKFEKLTGHPFSLPKNPIKVTASKVSRTEPAKNFPPPCEEPGADQVPACLKLADRIPRHGCKVAFMLSTVDVKN